MGLAINRRTLFSDLSAARGRAGRWPAPLCLAVAVLLVAALLGPSTFLIAKRAASTSPGIHLSSAQPGETLDHHPDKLSNGTGEERDGDTTPDPKRPKAFLHAKGKIIGKILPLVVLWERSLPRVDDAGPFGQRVFEAESAPTKIITIPQLLQRPPPDVV